jgi:hypothetical protein
MKDRLTKPAQSVEVDRWIPVTERLPSECGLKLCWCPELEDDFFLAGYQTNQDYTGWFDDDDHEYEPTHWLDVKPPESAGVRVK